MASVNWSSLRENAEIPNNDPVPPGPYSARVDAVEIRTTKTGKPMFMLTFVVTDGPYAKRKVWSNMVLSAESPKAMGFFFKDMAALGADDAFFATEPELDAVAQRIMGANVSITVRLQKDDPSRNEIARISPIGASAAVATPSFAVTSPAAPGAPPVRPF